MKFCLPLVEAGSKPALLKSAFHVSHQIHLKNHLVNNKFPVSFWKLAWREHRFRTRPLRPCITKENGLIEKWLFFQQIPDSRQRRSNRI
jgi:hypothetical protein